MFCRQGQQLSVQQLACTMLAKPTEKNSTLEDLLAGPSWPEGQILRSLPCSQLAAGYCGVIDASSEVFLG